MEKYITAIDLGTHMIKAAIGEMTPDGIIKVVAYSEFPSNGIVRGEINVPKKVVDVLSTTIDDLNNGKYSITSAFFNLSVPNFRIITENSIKNRPDREAYVTRYEIDTMLKEMYNTKMEERERIVYVSPQFYNLDEYLCQTDIEDMIGSRIEANYKLFVGKKSGIDAVNFVAKKNEIMARKVFFSPAASAASTLSEEDKELGVVLVDIGAGTTDVMIYLDNVLKHAASIPFGGNAITQDIKEECCISLKHAEQLKIKAGSCVSEYIPDDKYLRYDNSDYSDKLISYKHLVRTIEARCLEIMMTVNKEIHESGLYDDLKAGIVLTGGGANLTHLGILAKQVTGMDVRVLGPSAEYFTSSSRDEIYQPSSATLAGLLIEGFNYIQEQADYMTEEKDLFGQPVQQQSKPEEKPKPKSGSRTNIFGGFGSIFNNNDNEV